MADEKATPPSQEKVIVCVEIGTSASGMGYCYLNTTERNIVLEQNWSTSAVNKSKTRTCILLNDKRELVAFGNDAINQFIEIQQDREDAELPLEELDELTLGEPEVSKTLKPIEDVHLFLSFKMALMALEKAESVNVKSVQYLNRPSITVPIFELFRETFRFFKTHALKQLKDVAVDEIRWVITVPSIWNERAKHMMCLAAKDAGMCENEQEITIAFEPEAASNWVAWKSPAIRSRIKKGDNIIVCDAGGGTVDVVVQTLKETPTDGKTLELEEVIPRSGGPWGSVSIDEAFAKLMRDTFGRDFMEFYEKNFSEFQVMLNSFEVVKIRCQDERKRIEPIAVPKFNELWKKFHKKNVDMLPIVEISKVMWGMHGVSISETDELILSVKTFQSLFASSINSIIQHLKETVASALLASRRVAPVFIFLVGGFGESKLLLRAIQEKLPSPETFVPSYAAFAVLAGGVLMGSMESPESGYIRTRISPFGFGIETHTKWDAAAEVDEKYRVMLKDGRIRSEKFLNYHIMPGQKCAPDEMAQCNYGPLYNDMEEVELKVYQSIDKKIRHVDEAGCTKVGTFTLKLDPVQDAYDTGFDVVHQYVSHTRVYLVPKTERFTRDSNRDIAVAIGMKGTLLVCSAVDMSTGRKVKSEFRVFTRPTK